MALRSASNSDPPTRVGIGIPQRGGSFLVRRRPEGTPLAGCWEFPGGKCEGDESPEATVVRECREETGLDVVVGRLRRVITHSYPHGQVELYYFDVALADEAAEPTAETGFVWVDGPSLGTLPFPEANAPLIAELMREVEAGVVPPVA